MLQSKTNCVAALFSHIIHKASAPKKGSIIMTQ